MQYTPAFRYSIRKEVVSGLNVSGAAGSITRIETAVDNDLPTSIKPIAAELHQVATSIQDPATGLPAIVTAVVTDLPYRIKGVADDLPKIRRVAEQILERLEQHRHPSHPTVGEDAASVIRLLVQGLACALDASPTAKADAARKSPKGEGTENTAMAGLRTAAAGRTDRLGFPPPLSERIQAALADFIATDNTYRSRRFWTLIELIEDVADWAAGRDCGTTLA
jgi:hypothetical protein